MKFWMCFRCKRILEAEYYEIVPRMSEGWAYGLTPHGHMVILCPVCRVVIKDRKTDD